MTDQQTSRTNITEALRAALKRVLAVAMTEEEDWTPAVQDEWAAAAKQAGEVLALAAEPRSDAVTAPDEPSTEAGRRLLDDPDEGYPIDPDSDSDLARGWRLALAQRIVAIEREARAASASVPPLDENFIWLHPGRYSGEPCIGGHRIPTEVIAELVSAGDDGQTIIDGYDITRTQVILACWYEARHGQRRNWGDWLNDWEPAMWRGDFDDVPLPAAETPEQGRGDE